MSDKFMIDKIINLGFYSEDIKKYLNEKIKESKKSVAKIPTIIKFEKNLTEKNCFKLRNSFKKFEKPETEITHIVLLKQDPKDVIKFGKKYYAFGKLEIISEIKLLNLVITIVLIKKIDIFKNLILEKGQFKNITLNKMFVCDGKISCVVGDDYYTFKNSVFSFIKISKLSNFYCNLLENSNNTIIKNIDEKLISEIRDFTNKTDMRKSGSGFKNRDFLNNLEELDLCVNKEKYIEKFRERLGLERENVEKFIPIDISNLPEYKGDIEKFNIVLKNIPYGCQINKELKEELSNLFKLLDSSPGLENEQTFAILEKNHFLEMTRCIRNFWRAKLITLPPKTKIIRLSNGNLIYFCPNEKFKDTTLKIGDFNLTLSKENTSKEILKLKFNPKKEPFLENIMSKKPFLFLFSTRASAKIFFDFEDEDSHFCRKINQIENVISSNLRYLSYSHFLPDVLNGYGAVYPIDRKKVDNYFDNYPESTDLKHFLENFLNN